MLTFRGDGRYCLGGPLYGPGVAMNRFLLGFSMRTTACLLAATALPISSFALIDGGQASAQAASSGSQDSAATSAEAQARMYMALVGAAKKTAQNVLCKTKKLEGVVLYDARMLSDLPTLRAFDAQYQTLSDREQKDQQSVRKQGTEFHMELDLSQASDVATLLGAVVPFFSAAPVATVPTPTASDPDLLVYGTVAKSLLACKPKFKVFYPVLFPTSATVADKDPITRTFELQRKATNDAAVDASLVRQLAVPRLNQIAPPKPSDPLKASLAAASGDASTFPLSAAGVQPAPVAKLVADLRAVRDAAQGDGDLVKKIDALIEAVMKFAALDDLIAVKGQIDALATSLSGPPEAQQAKAGDSSSNPSSSAAPSSDSLGVVLARAFQYQALIEKQDYAILRLKVETSAGTNRIDKLGYNISSIRASGSATVSYVLLDKDGSVLDFGTTIAYVPFVLDKDALHHEVQTVDDDGLVLRP